MGITATLAFPSQVDIASAIPDSTESVISTKSLSESLLSNLIPISIVSLIFMVVIFIISNRNFSNNKKPTKSDEPIDMDAAFDDLGPSHEKGISENNDSEPSFSKSDDQILANLDGVFEELTGQKPTSLDVQGIPSAPDLEEAKASLDLEDIEALFEE